jgi:hypothetical protein
MARSRNGSSRLGVYRVPAEGLLTERNKLTLGRREYELANHLGNVLAVVSDAKLPAAKVLSHTDYYAFGSAMPGRSGGAGYRYGFNTQERSPELAPDHYTAEFWEYDARIGRRWNLDPVVKVHESGYSVLGENPLLMIDINGDDWIVNKTSNKDGSTHYNLTFRARLVNESGKQYSREELQGFVDRIKDGLGGSAKQGEDKAFNGNDGNVSWSINIDLEVGTDENTNENHHLIKIVDDGDERLGKDGSGRSDVGKANGGQREIFINDRVVNNRPANESGLDANRNPSLERTAAHEVGHSGGLLHPIQHARQSDFRHIPQGAFERKPRNLMHQSKYLKVAGFSLVGEQLSLMHRLYQNGALKIRR